MSKKTTAGSLCYKYVTVNLDDYTKRLLTETIYYVQKCAQELNKSPITEGYLYLDILEKMVAEAKQHRSFRTTNYRE